MNDATRILQQIEQGEESAADELLPLVYEELRRLAKQKLSQEKPGQTLQPTALVHEAYLRLLKGAEDQHWNSRGHFFAAAAESMRRILIEQARRKGSRKGGGGMTRVDIATDHPEVLGPQLDLIALDEVLARLESDDPRAAQVVKLRFFAGLKVREAAEALGISVATAENDWAYAKSWLRMHLS